MFGGKIIMGFRTVAISKRCKLEYSLNYLVYRGEEEKRIHLSEINTLIIQSTAVSITTSLLSELSERKIKVIFCDSKNNPQSELIPYYGCHNSSKRIIEQIEWSNESKDSIWSMVIKEKIINQAKVLRKYEIIEESDKLLDYTKNIESGDRTNREGHAAKVYFNALYGFDFRRSDDNLINAILNYGYAILLSAINREIVAYGYLTQLGIHHRNEYNDFNLGCDLMEPFRPIIDDYAKTNTLNDKNFKSKLNSILLIDTIIDNKSTSLENAIKIYCQSIFGSLLSPSFPNIQFISNYELPLHATTINV